MKKALSLVLAIMMVFALSTTTFAYDNKDRVVGKTGETPSYENGVETFSTGTLPSTSITITATASKIQSRYAVDIEYNNMTLDITGTAMVWDVTQLKYVPADTSLETNLAKKEFPVNVTNYSDQPVYLKAQITEGKKAPDLSLTYKGVTTGGTISGYTYTATIAKNLAGTALADAQHHEFMLVVDSSAWQNVTDYYMTELNGSGGGTVTIATLDITISKDPA